MKSILCALSVALFVQLAISAPAPTTTSEMPPSMVMMEQTMSVGRLDQMMVFFGTSPCVASCMMKMDSNMNSTKTDENDDDDSPAAHFQEVCDDYLAAAECFKSCPDVDDHMFDVIASGANYMCVEKRAEFERAMPCVRQQKKAMKKECRHKCSTDDKVIKVMKNESMSGASFHRNSTVLVSQLGELCTVLHCSIECGRDFLNEHCDPAMHVGNLLNEVIIRPLEKNAELLREMGPDVQDTINRSLPKSCAFIFNADQLNALRHGPLDIGSNDLGTPEPMPINHSQEPMSSTQEVDLQSRERRSYSSSPNAFASSAIVSTSAMMMYV